MQPGDPRLPVQHPEQISCNIRKGIDAEIRLFAAISRTPERPSKVLCRLCTAEGGGSNPPGSTPGVPAAGGNPCCYSCYASQPRFLAGKSHRNQATFVLVAPLSFLTPLSVLWIDCVLSRSALYFSVCCSSRRMIRSGVKPKTAAMRSKLVLSPLKTASRAGAIP